MGQRDRTFLLLSPVLDTDAALFPYLPSLYRSIINLLMQVVRMARCQSGLALEAPHFVGVFFLLWAILA